MSAPSAVLTDYVIVGCFGNGKYVAVPAFIIAFYIDLQQMHYI